MKSWEESKMKDLVMQYVDKVALDVVSLAVVILTGYGSKAIQKAKVYFESKTRESNRQLLQMIAQDTVLYVEQHWKPLDGPSKFSQAVQHAAQVLQHHGLNVNTQDLQAAIQGAYVLAKSKGLIDGQGSGAANEVQSVQQTQQTPA
jgi:ketosteroid isomerase-like protein